MSWDQFFDYSDYGQLLGLVANSVLACAILGIVGGLIGVFVVQRDMAFAVHGISELSFAGAAAALLIGVDVLLGSILGSVIAAAIIGLLGARARDRNSIVGVLMPFGLGLGILFLALYQGRSANKFGLLTGQIVSVGGDQLWALAGISAVVFVVLLIVWRPLTFDSLDPEAAAARGVPGRRLSLVFMLLLGLMVAVAVQIIGALLVLALLVTPAAAASRVTHSATLVPILSMAFGLVSALGGILIAIGSSLPVSPFITTISFVIWLVCRDIGRTRDIRRFRRAAEAQVLEAPRARPMPAASPAARRGSATRCARRSPRARISSPRRRCTPSCATPAHRSDSRPSTARSPTSPRTARRTTCSRAASRCTAPAGTAATTTTSFVDPAGARSRSAPAPSRPGRAPSPRSTASGTLSTSSTSSASAPTADRTALAGGENAMRTAG